ncbi:MAG TPA: hypothetical protein VFE40_13500, partial [Jatrophihabitantaceae bacterium]|nr:hypothetical protein [Jatrophihabitantaceae bacterium]
DTATYRWSALPMAGDVGGDPAAPTMSPADFHLFCALRQARRPDAMTTLTTHDTKRSEDVRARLCVLSELPEEWSAAVAIWQARATSLLREQRTEPQHAASSPEGQWPDAAALYLLWQTVISCWPIGEDRLLPYLTKALREAKVHTSWTAPDEAYEKSVLDFARLALSDEQLRAAIEKFSERVAKYATINSLTQKLLQLTMTGVPDVYQGSEIDFQALVDPDNRRPVDFAALAGRLDAVAGGRFTAGSVSPDPTDLPARPVLSEAKMLVVAKALRLRREHPDWFDARAGQTPLFPAGPAAEHAVSFLRGRRVAVVGTRLPVGLKRAGGWRGTALNLPAGTWRCELTGRVYEMGTELGDEVRLEQLTRVLPVALLVLQDER